MKLQDRRLPLYCYISFTIEDFDNKSGIVYSCIIPGMSMRDYYVHKGTFLISAFQIGIKEFLNSKDTVNWFYINVI